MTQFNLHLYWKLINLFVRKNANKDILQGGNKTVKHINLPAQFLLV